VEGQRKALVVASDEYDHEGLRHLVAPAADAAALAEVLGDPKIGDFDVQVVRNESAHAVQERIEELLLEARPEDVLLLHFSCHGLKSESGELFFAARNTRPNRLGSTAIAADFVQRCMRASRSRSIVLLLDCCYGGAFGQGVAVRASGDVNVLDSFPGGRLGGGRGRAVITASNAMEYAFEGDRLADDHSQRPSVFTSALVDGLATGDADRDEDGWVSLNELYDYVFDRVRAVTPHQTPGRDIEMSGELYLARSRRRRIRPLPIPADLQAAVTDPNVYTRIGAVAELRSRLGSDDLPMAAGAHEALLNVARHDIKYVAEVAAEALRDVALQVEVTQLTFGRAARGSDPPHQTVRLLGPPLARACMSQPSHSWIRVEDTAGGLDVSVDTTVVGALRGQITITGLTGQTTLQVEVDISPDRDEESRQREASEPSHVDNVTPDVEPPADATQGPPLPASPHAQGRTSATQHAPQHAGQRRWIVYATILVALVGGGVTAALLIPGRDGSPGSGDAEGGPFTMESPWRLVIRDEIQGTDNGCTVTVTNTDTDESWRRVDVYGEKSFQMQQSGTFRWEANDPGCLVIQRSGSGTAEVPFAWEAATGDTDAFAAAGEISIEVTDFSGYSECDFRLHDAADGQLVNFGKVTNGGENQLILSSEGRSQVYLADVECGVRVSAGEA
jgi:hypothetical protein